MRKSKFWTFMLSLIPGAGQMYQGLLKRGVSIMVLFGAVIWLAVLMSQPAVMVLLPVVWFYAFFDAWNRSGMTLEELSYLPDSMVFNWRAPESLLRSRSVWAGVFIIFIGALTLYYTVLEDILARYVDYGVLRRVPGAAVALLIILLGVRMTVGSRDKNLPAVPEEEKPQ